LFKSYQQLHLTFAASSVACLETISWIPLDYPNADKPFSQVRKYIFFGITKLNKMEYINLMMTGNFDEFWFKNMMLAYLGHLNIQWDWPRCPSTWRSRHLYPFVMLNFQCLVASSLGTINASQLFFEGSHVFSIFSLSFQSQDTCLQQK